MRADRHLNYEIPTNQTDVTSATYDALVGAFSVSSFCAWASISRRKFYDELAAGRLRARKVGRKTLVLRSDAIDWLEQLPALDRFKS